MNTVILEVRSLSDTLADAARAMRSRPRGARGSHWFCLTRAAVAGAYGQTMGIAQKQCGAGAMSIREAPRRVGRDVKAVHGDVVALLDAGVLSRAADGASCFPFEAVKLSSCLRRLNRACSEAELVGPHGHTISCAARRRMLCAGGLNVRPHKACTSMSALLEIQALEPNSIILAFVAAWLVFTSSLHKRLS